MPSIPASMRAVLLSTFGPPSVLDPVLQPVPAPARGEVLVRVEAAAVNRIDLEIRSGQSRNQVQLPLILGREAAGTVAMVGMKVEGWLPGQRVLVLPQQACGDCDECRSGAENLCKRAGRPGVNRPGGYAEYTVAPQSALLRIPHGVTTRQAACAAITMGTAWRALGTLAHVQPGEWVLVTGAAGGLGSACVAVAKYQGARVVAAVGSEPHGRFADAIGADAVVDYSTGKLSDLVLLATGGARPAVAVEHVGGQLFEQVLACMAPRGRLIVAGAHAAETAALDLLHLFRSEIRIQGAVSQSTADVAAVLELMATGVIAPAIGAAFDLEHAADAHRVIAERQVEGKVVLEAR